MGNISFEELKSYYQGKRVLVTGHTGFKGSWLCRVLTLAGAQVMGYALEAPPKPAIFRQAGLGETMESVIGDVRSLKDLQAVFKQCKPQVVFHLAAQPIVRESYENPVYTYETNVMGTVNVLECARRQGSVCSLVNVTTDKVYENREWEYGYRECDPLDGYDPYSNSKSCSELVTHSYKKSFFADGHVRISTARAGNVIGGGDFAPNRILPDCIRAVQNGQSIHLRNPNSVRPYQHVLEPVTAYLMIVKAQYEDPSVAGSYNVGPKEADCLTTGELVTRFCRYWNRSRQGSGEREISCKDSAAGQARSQAPQETHRSCSQ